MMFRTENRWAIAAATGVLSAVAACGGEIRAPEVPGAPPVDPAGVPVARAAEPKATGGAAMSCSAAMGCGAKKADDTAGEDEHEHGEPRP